MSTPLEKPLQARPFKTTRTIAALVLREMETTYGRSPGGYIWAILEPVAAILVMTFVFTLALRSPSLGTSFPLFYATGYLPFSIYLKTAAKTSKALKFSRQLLQYPGVKFTDAIIARLIVNTLTQLLIFYVLIVGLHYVYDLTIVLNVQAILSSLVMAVLLGIGIGCLNCFLMSVFPVWEQFWGILTAPMFILSGILYTPEDLSPLYRDYLWYNPLVHITSEMRRGFYPTYDPHVVYEPYVLGIALVTTLLGLVFLSRYYRDILNL